MSDPTPTRQETVEAAIASDRGEYGNDAFSRLYLNRLEEISVSLAIIADNTTSST